jgi:phosphoglycerate kinase
MADFPTLESLAIQPSDVVLMRADLNVPMDRGNIRDDTRIARIIPTIRALQDKQARIVILSHFDRPKGQYNPDMSLAPLVDALSQNLGDTEVKFGVDCIGKPAEEAVANLENGEVLLLENVRFHAGEEENDSTFSSELASLGKWFVNDAFSCSHRSHASVVGIADHLPHAAGLLMQKELEVLYSIFNTPKRPIATIVGGAKISTKLALLENLTETMDYLIIGGAMANTFLAAQGYAMGKSLMEKELLPTAQAILHKAEQGNCTILLPEDVIVTKDFAAHAPCRVTLPNDIAEDEMILDLGPNTTKKLADSLRECHTVVWNGPLGAFETSPFDVSTIHLARLVVSLTAAGELRSIAGGGDTVAALNHAGLSDQFTYVSTAGGAFLEWLEGCKLPGVAKLETLKAA